MANGRTIRTSTPRSWRPARISAAAISLSHQRRDERGGLSRRELLVRGGAAAAAVGGMGAFAGSAGAASDSVERGEHERQVHGHAAGAHPRRRVPDPGHREAGVQGPRLHREADPGRLREAAADRDHVAGHVRRLRRLQLPVASRLAVGQPAAGRHDEDPELELLLQALLARQAQPGLDAAARSATATRRSGRRTSTRTARPVCPRSPAGRRTTSRSFAGSARTASRSAASRSPATSSARRPTSTPTRWATTPT